MTDNTMPYSGAGEHRTLLDTHVSFNNGGISIDMIEQRSGKYKRHQMQVRVSNMGQEVSVSVPLVPSMAKTFELLAKLVKEQTTDPNYMAPLYNDVTCGPIADVNGYYDAQGNKVAESWDDRMGGCSGCCGNEACGEEDATPDDQGS